MLRFKLYIDCENAAFGDANGDPCDPSNEVARILAGVVRTLEQGGTSGTLFDSNGNSCGEAFYTNATTHSTTRGRS